jgi:phage gp46-like protein
VGEETQKLLWISPGLDRRLGIQLKSVALEKRTVRIGSTSEPYGERFAQWIENGVALEVHARASRHLSQHDFSRFLNGLTLQTEVSAPA